MHLFITNVSPQRCENYKTTVLQLYQFPHPHMTEVLFTFGTEEYLYIIVGRHELKSINSIGK